MRAVNLSIKKSVRKEKIKIYVYNAKAILISIQKHRFYLWSKFKKCIVSIILSVMIISLREFFIIVSIAERKLLTYAI